MKDLEGCSITMFQLYIKER